MLKTKGTWAVTVAWIKGHTGSDREKWGLTEEQQEGNKAADEAALLARTGHEADLKAVAEWATGKHKAYDTLGKDIDELAIQVIMEGTRREKLRNRCRNQAGEVTQKKILAKRLGYPEQGGPSSGKGTRGN